MSQDNFVLTQSNISSFTINSFKLNRLKNYARQTAEEANGGLQKYRAEPSMHGPAFDSPYVINEDGTVTFTFLGKLPNTSEYIYESIVNINPDNFALEIEYNGSVRESVDDDDAM